LGYAHADSASGATAVALHAHDLASVSYSFTAHAKDILRDSVERSALERKLTRARFAVTVSEYNRRDLAGLAGGDRVVRIHNGVDLMRFSPNGATTDDPPLVLAVGRFIEEKGFTDLVYACGVLHADGVRFRSLIVGKGELEASLRRRVARLGLHEVTLAGPLPRERPLDAYGRAAVVVFPWVVGSDGNCDGLPTVLVEATAFEVPVVATDVTASPELVEHERTGLIVPRGRPDLLAGAIRRVLEEPVTAAAWARAGRARVERDFDLHRNVKELRALFEEATAR
jgi:colanic acid/amylovoran biosynthesis glycosyltransferase